MATLGPLLSSPPPQFYEPKGGRGGRNKIFYFGIQYAFRRFRSDGGGGGREEKEESLSPPPSLFPLPKMTFFPSFFMRRRRKRWKATNGTRREGGEKVVRSRIKIHL